MADTVCISVMKKTPMKVCDKFPVIPVKASIEVEREQEIQEGTALDVVQEIKEMKVERPEIVLIRYLGLSILSEVSKIAIFAFLFRSQIELFLFAMGVMMLMRRSNGGMHCKRYLACFAVSLLYLFLCIKVLPVIPLPKSLMLMILLICICVNYRIGLVVSKYHKNPSEGQKKKGSIQSFVIVFFYMTALFILPENIYMCTGFWVIVLHSLQLAFAEFNLKGEFLDEKGVKFYQTCRGRYQVA